MSGFTVTNESGVYSRECVCACVCVLRSPLQNVVARLTGWVCAQAKVTPATNVTTVTKFEEGGATKQEPPKQQATATSDKEPAVGNSEII